MDTKGNRDNPSGAEASKSELQHSGQESERQRQGAQVQISNDAMKSLADQLSALIGRTPNGSHEVDAQQAKRFEIYSQAFAGFAQNNVSKSEGFIIGVDFQNTKTKEDYVKLTKELIEKKKQSDIDRYKTY